MSSNYSIEIIPAAAISEAIAGTPALIIDTTGSDRMASVIGKLYSHGQYKTYFTRPGINQLAKTIDLVGLTFTIAALPVLRKSGFSSST